MYRHYLHNTEHLKWNLFVNRQIYDYLKKLYYGSSKFRCLLHLLNNINSPFSELQYIKFCIFGKWRLFFFNWPWPLADIQGYKFASWCSLVIGI